MSDFHKQSLNPLEIIKRITGVESEMIPHVVYDPQLRKGDCQYCIIRQCSHDGTDLFTRDLILQTLNPVVMKTSFYKSNPPDPKKELIDVKYTVGPLWLATVYGKVNLPAGAYPGQKERTRMPVKVEYIYAE